MSVTDSMSITKELRKYADELARAAAMKSEHGFSPVGMRLSTIADSIDEAHEREMQQAHADGLNEQLEVAEHNRTRNVREYARMCHENEQLRELLRESVMDYRRYAEKYGLAPYLDDVNEHLDARLRELGIEVDE